MQGNPLTPVPETSVVVPCHNEQDNISPLVAAIVAARARGDSWVRRVCSKIANAVRNRLSGESISDAGCCFRAFRRECLADLKFFKGAHRFLPTLIKMEGYRVCEVAIGHAARHSGRSHYGIGNRLFKSFVDLLAVRWMKQRHLCYQVCERFNERP